MSTFKTLLVGAAVGVLLAVVGVAAVSRSLNQSAADVAKKMSSNSQPDVPPDFYGSR
jgi:hypothetical protein